MEKLVIKNLTFLYQSKKEKVIALNDISFTLHTGELLVIVGPSGCGKSTLLNVIAGFKDYQQGEMYFNKLPAEELKTQDRNLSYVFQKANLYPFYTIYNNIALPLKAQKISLDEIDRRVHEVSRKLGIDYLLSRKPKQLSGGQQQRVALAKALIKLPDIYLFDEPFSNLDPLTRIELRKEIKKMKQEYNATMIFVTHDLNEALFLADRIIVMNEGRIVQEGTVDDIINKPECEFVKNFFSRRDGYEKTL